MTPPEKKGTPTPARAIRRFDVFAEVSRQERLRKGYDEEEAKGYGIWLAKVVASRRFGKSSDGSRKGASASGPGEAAEEPKFRSLGDEIQTDDTFDHEIIERMGAEFYDTVFVPAITGALERGEKYEDIRDSIRKEWKPARKSSK